MTVVDGPPKQQRAANKSEFREALKSFDPNQKQTQEELAKAETTPMIMMMGMVNAAVGRALDGASLDGASVDDRKYSLAPTADRRVDEFFWHVAKTGNALFPWKLIRDAFLWKLEEVMKAMLAMSEKSKPTTASTPAPIERSASLGDNDDLDKDSSSSGGSVTPTKSVSSPSAPGSGRVSAANHTHLLPGAQQSKADAYGLPEQIRDRILLTAQQHTGIPFTFQRICELLCQPLRHYKRPEKLFRALEKNISVVSYVRPDGSRITSESNELLNDLDELDDNEEPIDDEADDRWSDSNATLDTSGLTTPQPVAESSSAAVQASKHSSGITSVIEGLFGGAKVNPESIPTSSDVEDEDTDELAVEDTDTTDGGEAEPPRCASPTPIDEQRHQMQVAAESLKRTPSEIEMVDDIDESCTLRLSLGADEMSDLESEQLQLVLRQNLDAFEQHVNECALAGGVLVLRACSAASRGRVLQVLPDLPSINDKRVTLYKLAAEPGRLVSPTKTTTKSSSSSAGVTPDDPKAAQLNNTDQTACETSAAVDQNTPPDDPKPNAPNPPSEPKKSRSD